MFWKKKQPERRYDPEAVEPVLHKSICTGETTAGFRDRKTGRFREVMLVRNERDLKEFMDAYGIETVPKTEY